MSIKETLRKAAGLFVELPEDQTDALAAAEHSRVSDFTETAPEPAPTRTVADVVKAAPGPSLAEIQATPAPQEPMFNPDGSVNFHAIYQSYQVPATPFTAEQVLDILHQLPESLPIDAKRSTMKVTLGAMTSTTGASAETVVADASRKLASLSSYSEGFDQHANEYITKAEAEIVRLQGEIEKNKANIDNAKAKAQQVKDACLAESDKLDDILEFFSLDVAPSKYAKP